MKRWNVKYKFDTIPTIKGNDYEIGFALGELFRGEYKKLKKFEKQLRDPRVEEYISWLLPTLRRNCRPAYDEMCGRADGAKIDIKIVALSLCQTELRGIISEDCTTIMVSAPKNSLLAHNEDGAYEKYNMRVVKIERQKSCAHYEIACARFLSTSTFFVSKNLVYSMNSLATNKVDIKSMPTYCFRKLLACCKTFEELLEVVKNTPITTAVGINVCDVKSKKFYYIEKVLDGFDIKPIEGINLHTNHILAKKFLKFRPDRLRKVSTSLSRYTIAKSIIGDKTDMGVDEAFKTLTYYNTCDFNSVMVKGNTGCHSKTFGTYILDLNNKLSCLYVHNKKKTVFDFDLPKF